MTNALICCRPSATNNPSDILYYAVNSMNLPTENMHTEMDTASMTRVTYDPIEGQEALNRSFQPFSDQLYSRDTRPGKRRAGEDNSLHMDKRYQQSLQSYENDENFAIS